MKFLLAAAVLICALAACKQELPPEIADLIQRAEQGDAEAQYTLGHRYYTGDGVQRYGAEGIKWWRLAAKQGHAESQHDLGQAYYDGIGVAQDYVEAVKWYRLAAEQGNAKDQYSLGVMYDSGQGVAQDLVQAHMWLSLAVSTANPYDATTPFDPKSFAETRDVVADKMTSAQIAEAQRLAREWKPKTWEELQAE